MTLTDLIYQKLKVELAQARYRRAKENYERILKMPYAWTEKEIARMKMEIAQERYQDEIREYCLLI